MQKIYDAENTMDASIVKGLLEEHEIPAFINGQYLQGGIGELPVSGIVSVSVPHQHAENAKQIVKDYFSATPVIDDSGEGIDDVEECLPEPAEGC